VGAALPDEIIEEIKEKILKATNNDQNAAMEFDKRLLESTEPPIIVALKVVEDFQGDISVLFDGERISSVTKDFEGTVVGKITNISYKEFERNGKRHKMLTGMIRDNSGAIPITIFDPPKIGEGDTILIKNVVGDEFNGKLRLKTRNNSEITPLKRGSDGQAELVTISKINPDMKFISVEGELRIIEKNRPVKGEQSRLTVGILTDSTGTIQVRAWDIDLEEGLVRFHGAYPKIYNNKLYLNVNKNSKIEVLRRAGKPENLYQLAENGSGEIEINVRILGFIAKNPFVDVCSECGRVVRDGRCNLHPEAKPARIIRVTAIIDDGFSSQYATLYQSLLIKLIGEDAVKSSLASLDISLVRERLNELALNEFKVKVSAYRSSRSNSGEEARTNMEIVEIQKFTEDDYKISIEKLRGEFT
jgi:hypothetical protein